MKAVVLAGGEGTRLKPLTYKRPKPLMPVAGRPCIDYVIRSLVASGFQEIITTTAYLSDTLIKSIGDGLDYNASILYSFEPNPAGTAGAVRRALYDERKLEEAADQAVKALLQKGRVEI